MTGYEQEDGDHYDRASISSPTHLHAHGWNDNIN